MISLAEAKSHVRVDFTDEDADISLKLKLAVAIVEDFIGTASSAALIAGSDVIDAATLLVFGELYANRESSADPLSPTVRAILGRLRMPGVA